MGKDNEIVHLLLHTRDDLQQLYKTHRPEEEMRKAKQANLDGLKARYAEVKSHWAGDSRYDRFFAKPINNARLCTIAAYHDLVPAFTKKIREHNGDLDAFFKEMESLNQRSNTERLAALGLSAPSPEKKVP